LILCQSSIDNRFNPERDSYKIHVAEIVKLVIPQ
jgi:hypothetical protein